MIETKLEGWDEAGKVLAEGARELPRAIREAVAGEGEFFREKIIAQIDEGNFAPLSPLSAIFGGDGGHKPLERFARELVVKRIGDAVIVSFRSPRTAQLAAISEEGASFDVTASDAQRRYVMAALREAGVLKARDPHPNPPGTPLVLSIKIPPRPFVGPTFERWGKPRDVGDRVTDRLSKSMGGRLGR